MSLKNNKKYIAFSPPNWYNFAVVRLASNIKTKRKSFDYFCFSNFNLYSFSFLVEFAYRLSIYFGRLSEWSASKLSLLPFAFRKLALSLHFSFPQKIIASLFLGVPLRHIRPLHFWSFGWVCLVVHLFTLEDCQSGRMCLSRKQVCRKTPQVQILYLPPIKTYAP